MNRNGSLERSAFGFGGSDFVGELGDGSSEHRVDPVGHELRRGNQGKGALVEPGMGNLQLRAPPHQVSSHEQIEIEDPWAPSLLGRAIPSGCGFDLATGSEQGSRITRPAQERGGVAVVRLIGSDGPGPPQP